MVDISTEYLGLKLQSPIIAGSSGLTNSTDNVKKLAENGAGAVVLKSIFEEEVAYEYADFIATSQKPSHDHQYFDYDGQKNPIAYYDYVIREENLKKNITLVEESKTAVSIPVIASINCFLQSVEWISYAKNLESAGADALELNMFFPPTDFKRNAEDTEKLYFDTIQQITGAVSIPIALKISYYFTNLGSMIQKLSNTDIKGLVLFNRFFSPDFDIDTFEVKPSFVFSTPSDLCMSLRWIAIMAEKVNCDLAASTGVHDGDAVIKQLLAGAATVQVASALYDNGIGQIREMLNRLEAWMEKKHFDSLPRFRGKMSQDKSTDPSIYERVQFMRYFGGKKNVKMKS
jgi:dihydroorotate dehydrogenase (fumarate)